MPQIFTVLKRHYLCHGLWTGTLFNPSNSICDWPNSVPECAADGSLKKQLTDSPKIYDQSMSSKKPIKQPNFYVNNQEIYHYQDSYQGPHHTDLQGEFSQLKNNNQFIHQLMERPLLIYEPKNHDDDKFNGHAYPYKNSQLFNQNEPEIPNISMKPPKKSNKEKNGFFEVKENRHEQVWTWPAENSQPLSGDRSKYGRTNDELPSLIDARIQHSESNNQWNKQENQPGSFQPSTWRGMGTGFENRPSYPGRGTTEGLFIIIFFYTIFLNCIMYCRHIITKKIFSNFHFYTHNKI